MDICEKIAYIKGLAEGLSLDDSTKEGKILNAIIDLLGDITEEICEIEDGCDELMEQIDAVDEDLASLEDFIYEDDDCDCDCDCNCDDCCDCDDEEYFECECPSCGEIVCFDSDIDPEDLTCPACGEKFECIISEDDLDALDGEDEE